MGIYMSEKQYEELIERRRLEREQKKNLLEEKAQVSSGIISKTSVVTDKKQLKNTTISNSKRKTEKNPLTNKKVFDDVYCNIIPQSMEFVVPGDPFGKERPRVYDGVAITPEKTKNYEEYVRFCFLSSIKGSSFEKISVGAVGIEIIAIFKVPQQYPKWKKLMIATKKLLPIKKPDFDNIAKIISDSLNGIAWSDDAQITDCIIKKRYSEGECSDTGDVIIKIYTVDISDKENIWD